MLVLPLIDSDDLVDQGVKLFFLSDCSEGILDGVFKTEINKKCLALSSRSRGAMIC